MTHPSHLRVRSRTLPGPRRRWSTPPTKQCHPSSGEKDTRSYCINAQENVFRAAGSIVTPQLYCPQPFHSRISLLTQTSPPVLRHPYITWSQSYFTVFIILYFMCFPPPQIIVFLHPPHPAFDYLLPFSSSVVRNQWPRQALTDQHCPGF